MADPEWLRKAIADGSASVKGVNPSAFDPPVLDRAPDSKAYISWFRDACKACHNEKVEFHFAIMQFSLRCGWRRAHFRPARVLRSGKETYETPIDGEGKGFFDYEFVRERLIKVEAKFGKNVPSAEQLEWLEAYKAAGIECYIWYPKDCEQIIETLTCLRPKTS